MKKMNQFLGIVSVLVLLISLFTIPLGHSGMGRSEVQVVEFTQTFSVPTLVDTDGFTTINVQEASGRFAIDGNPLVPISSKTFEFPLGTVIDSLEILPSPLHIMNCPELVTPTPTKQKMSNTMIGYTQVLNAGLYQSAEPYPSTWGRYTTGAGLDTNNNHVLFLSFSLYPVQYLPQQKMIQWVDHITIRVSYYEPLSTPQRTDAYDLVIIAPEEFSDHLQTLLTHKNTHGVTACLMTLEDIDATSPGRDTQEKIKYFIKDALEEWNTKYVLLVGDMKKLPIRTTYASWWEADILCDLYYADIYDASFEFCTWDANENDRFGETSHEGDDIDGVDLLADVNIGRLPCSTVEEVGIVVDKIINYEEGTAGQSWFNTLVVAGGDTFPVGMGAPANVFEGEITNEAVVEHLSGFTPTLLWSSEHTLSASSFNREISKGAGFVSYAGHGFEHGWGTYRPNALRTQMIPFIDPVYFTPYIKKMTNSYKLPVMFWDACLTSKLDFNVSDLEHYYPVFITLLTRLGKVSDDTMLFYPCFAWSLVKLEGGGAIATIGSTRTAYTRVDQSGVYGGAGYLDVSFFDAYQTGATVGEMMTAAQNAYVTEVGLDYFTIEEFMLIGDPSLHVGGFQ